MVKVGLAEEEAVNKLPGRAKPDSETDLLIVT